MLAAIPNQITIDWASFWTNMGWVDIICFIFALIGLVIGIRKGLAGVLPGIIEVVAAQIMVVEYTQPLVEALISRVPVPPVFMQIVIFAAFAGATMLLIRFLFKLLVLIATVDFKQPLSNLGGAIFGALQFVLLFSLICEFLMLFPLPFIQESLTQKSISGPYLIQASEQVHYFFERWIPPAFQN